MTKGKTNIVRIVSVLIAVAAYSYLAYKLITFDSYDQFAEHFRNAGKLQYVCLVVAVSLFPLNIFLESCKWKYLLRNIEPMSFAEAQRQTYFGMTGAFLTPGRLGDYPARVTLMKNKQHWLTAVSLGFAGTFALSSLQIIIGIPAAVSSLGVKWYIYLLAVACLFLFFLSPRICRSLPTEKIKNEKIRFAVQSIGGISFRDMAVLLALSVLRYAVYCGQMTCVMYCSGVDIALADMITAILTYYLFVTLTPSLPVADAGIKGSWAILVFSQYSGNVAGIAMSAILLWIVNSVLPMLTGSVISYTGKQNIK